VPGAHLCGSHCHCPLDSEMAGSSISNSSSVRLRQLRPYLISTVTGSANFTVTVNRRAGPARRAATVSDSDQSRQGRARAVTVRVTAPSSCQRPPTRFMNLQTRTWMFKSDSKLELSFADQPELPATDRPTPGPACTSTPTYCRYCESSESSHPSQTRCPSQAWTAVTRRPPVRRGPRP
jgi:hypothetical protein